MATKKTAPAGSKETVYVDVDDEITHIIDKVKASDKKIVALVLPKRASMLQSIVNMKLLKKAAGTAKKNIVLITSETALMPLAGAAGIHVAKSLQSKPAIPPLPESMRDDGEAEEIVMSDEGGNLDKTAAVGTLAAAGAVAAAGDDDTETVEFDNLQVDDEPVAGAAAKKPKKLKHLKVPNFERFRLSMVLAVLGVVLLIVGWFLAFVVMPKATIAITTDTSTVVSSFDFTASTEATEVDTETNTIPAVLKESKKTDTEKGTATGERDDGTKASGQVTLSISCSDVDDFPVTVPSGTAVSTGGKNFIMQEQGVLSSAGGPGCRFVDTVKVAAAQNGDSFNIEDDQTFNVAGFSDVSGNNNSAFSGGTTKIVKIVSQKDVDDAVARINSRQGTVASDELVATLETEGLLPLKETLTNTDPKITVSPEVGKEAAEFTVTSETDYSMLGIERDDLVAVIRSDIEDEVDFEKQSIVDDGIDKAVMRINNNPNPGAAFLNFRTSVTAGPEIDEEDIKENALGKKRGEIEQYVESIPGVQEVEVTYSPFWVLSTPKAAKKITVEVEKPEVAETQETGNTESSDE